MFILLVKRIITGFLTIEYVEISAKILRFIIIINPSNNTVEKQVFTHDSFILFETWLHVFIQLQNLEWNTKFI